MKDRIIITMDGGVITTIDFQGRTDIDVEVRDYGVNGQDILEHADNSDSPHTFIQDEDGFYYEEGIWKSPQ